MPSPLIDPLTVAVPFVSQSTVDRSRCDLARLSKAGVGLRVELGVHRVARPRRVDLDPLRDVRYLAVQQESHRGRQGAIRCAAEPADRSRLHRRVPEYRGGLVVVPHVERLRQAAQPAPVGHPQEHQ